MSSNRFYTSLLFLVSLIGNIGAQRYFVTNHYAYDLFLVNPAVVSMYPDCFTVNAFYQEKWVGIDLAPTTQLLSFKKTFPSRFGIGAYGYNDRNGNHRELGLQQSFGYGITLAESRRRITNLHFGLSFLVNQRSVDMTKSFINGNIDPLLEEGKRSGYGYNANAGILLTVNYWEFGFSVTNLFPYSNTLYSKDNEPDIRRDLNLHMGTSFKIPDRNIYVEPMIYYRWNSYMDSRAEVNLKTYLPTEDPEFAWWGLLSYRRSMDQNLGTNLGLAATLGIIKDRISLGLEYEFGLTVAQVEYGSSFLVLAGYRFCRNRKFDPIPCAKSSKDSDIMKVGKSKKKGR